MILWVKYLTQRKLSESLNDKENTWVWLCCQRGPLWVHTADVTEGGDAIWSACWLITSAGLLLLLLHLESSSACLQLALLPSCRFKVTIPPVVHLKFLPQIPVGEFLQFCVSATSSMFGFVAMVPKVAPAIPCGADDLALPFVQCWYWHLINLEALLPENTLQMMTLGHNFFTLEWQVYIPAGNSIVSHTIYSCMHGPNVHS